jgi:DNA polymerase-3 subunit epsilon
MKVLFFDTETTGLWNFKAEYHAEEQPHLIELGARLVDISTNKVLEECNAFVQPVFFDHISTEITALTNITLEELREKGTPPTVVYKKFKNLHDEADYVCTHNWKFDQRIMNRFIHCLDKYIKWRPGICTMQISTPLCRLPGKYGYKWPKLQELHKFLFDTEFENAHTANADVAALHKCFIELLNRNHIPLKRKES